MPDAVNKRVIGSLSVAGPYKVEQKGTRAPQWGVMAVDSMTEDTSERLFPSFTKASQFISELAASVEVPVDPLADDPDDPPRNQALAAKRPAAYATGVDSATLNRSHTRREKGTGGPGATGEKDPNAVPFNLRSVVEVLEDEGLDPFVEVARVMKERVPVFDAKGNPVISDETGEPVTVPRIGGLDRAKIALELGQYIAPKLKAVEMKVEDKRNLSGAELDQRIAGLLAKAGVQVLAGEAIPPKETTE